VRQLLAQLASRFRPRTRRRVDFYAATWIDEIWVRSTVLAAARAGFAVRLAISGDRGGWPEDLLARYASWGVPLEWAPTVEALHALAMRVVVTASSGIPRSHFGPSLARLVHMPHSLASLHAIYPPDAFDGYDTLFAAGPHHEREFQALGRANGLGERPAIPLGYGKFDVMREEARQVVGETGGPVAPHALIAPSWGDNNLISLHGLALTQALVRAGWRVTLRPHPSFFIYPDGQLDAIMDRFAGHEMVGIERSTGGSMALWRADALVSDYSGMALEFAALRRRPVVFVDGPRKILNSDWRRLGVPAVEIDARASVGIIAEAGADGVVSALSRAIAAPAPDACAIAAYLHDCPDVGQKATALLGAQFSEVSE
jgi:hypothetical protein